MDIPVRGETYPGTGHWMEIPFRRQEVKGKLNVIQRDRTPASLQTSVLPLYCWVLLLLLVTLQLAKSELWHKDLRVRVYKNFSVWCELVSIVEQLFEFIFIDSWHFLHFLRMVILNGCEHFFENNHTTLVLISGPNFKIDLSFIVVGRILCRLNFLVKWLTVEVRLFLDISTNAVYYEPTCAWSAVVLSVHMGSWRIA